MVFEVELGDLFDHVVVGVGCKHDHAIVAVSDFLSIKLHIVVIFIARSEPVRIVRRVSIAAIVIVLRLLVFLGWLRVGRCNLLVVRGERKFLSGFFRSGRLTFLGISCCLPLGGNHGSLLSDNGLRNA